MRRLLKRLSLLEKSVLILAVVSTVTYGVSTMVSYNPQSANTTSVTDTNQSTVPLKPQVRQSGSPSANQSQARQVSQKPKSAPATTHSSQSKDYSCHKENIVHYKTVYEKVSYLESGQTQSSGGVDGYTQVCPGLSKKYQTYTFEPINKYVYVGTGPTAAEIQAEAEKQQEIAAQQAKDKADAERNAKIRGCIQYMNSIAPNSSAYLQCYNAY